MPRLNLSSVKMKSNIDLTEHGDFREPDYFQTASWISGLLRSNKRIPWTWGEFKEISCASDYGDKNNLFFTGTVESIRSKKKYLKYEDGKFCDRCGKPINRYKWFIFGNKSLCAECDDDLQLQFSKQHQKNKLKDYPVKLSSKYWSVYLNTKADRQQESNWTTLELN